MTETAAATGTARPRVVGAVRTCPVCGDGLRHDGDDVTHGRSRWVCRCGVSVSYDAPELRREGEDAEQWATLAAGSPERCVLKCALYGSEECKRCPVPDRSGRARCPACGGALYFLELLEGRVRYACNALKGCGKSYSFPLVEAENLSEQERARRRQASLDAETAAEEKRYRARRRRERRARQKARPLAGALIGAEVSAERGPQTP